MARRALLATMPMDVWRRMLMRHRSRKEANLLPAFGAARESPEEMDRPVRRLRLRLFPLRGATLRGATLRRRRARRTSLAQTGKPTWFDLRSSGAAGARVTAKRMGLRVGRASRKPFARFGRGRPTSVG
jgi:hypothetical protein